MKLLKTSFSALLLSLFVIGLAAQTNAQNRRAVVKTYNEGLELKKSENFQKAISTFNQTMANAKKLGEEGQDIVSRCEQQLADTYFKIAVSDYKALQNQQNIDNFDNAIASFEKALEIANEYNSSQIKDRATQIIPQLFYNKGVFGFKTKSYDMALDALNKAIERNSNYSNAYYQIALVKKNQEGVEQSVVIDAFKKALSVAESQNNSSVIEESNKQLGGIYLSRGHNLVEKQSDTQGGIEAYNTALNYTPENEQVFFRLAEAHNKVQEWNQAAEYAQKGLDLETGGKTEKAKYYFELGNAYKGMGQKEQACSAFSNAAYGSFKSSAEHEMEYQLKCDKATN